MMIHDVTALAGKHKARKRVGRGDGSGHGGTSGRGHKGAGSRSGFSRRHQFEGGQMPLARRLPKRGLHNLFRVTYQIVNVGALAVFGEGASVDPELLAGRGLVPRRIGRVKLLGEGDAPNKLVVRVHRVSATARRKIEEAGGSVELV